MARPSGRGEAYWAGRGAERSRALPFLTALNTIFLDCLQSAPFGPPHNVVRSKATPLATAADMTTRSAFKIEAPSRGPGRVDFKGPDERFGLDRTPKPKIQRNPSAPKINRIRGPPLYLSLFCQRPTRFTRDKPDLFLLRGAWTCCSTARKPRTCLLDVRL